MNNPRITKKEFGLIKGALRRVFSRSELRKQVIDASIVQHHDPTRKRVKTWCKCRVCGGLEAKSNMEVDHIYPVVPIGISFADMSLDDFLNRLWCVILDLQVICESCHDKKTAQEQKARKKAKKGQNNDGQS